jgi:dihydroorotase
MSTGVDQGLDLLLKGGHVVDPANNIDGVFDVGIRDGLIDRVAPDIGIGEAEHVIDVSRSLVTPGLLDIHVHCYVNRLHSGPGYWVDSLNADAHFLKEGVTTCVDTGTAGAQEMAHFRESVIDRAICRILAYVNIAAPGMGGVEQVITNFDVDAVAKAAADHSDVVVGVKTAHYWAQAPFDAEHPPWESVERAVDAGEACGMPVMVDFWPRPPERSYPDLILKKMRPGDIHTHVFARQFPVLDDEGRLRPYMREARARGIWFDLGHGAASFWFRNGAPAVEQGFVPDSISTDLHMANIRGPVASMLDTMSKCLAMGMPLQEVIYRSTVTPAQAIRRPELGTLTVGAVADVAVLECLKGDFAYRDCGYGKIEGKDRLQCRMTIRNGRVAWDRDALTAPLWGENPEDGMDVSEAATGIKRHWYK